QFELIERKRRLRASARSPAVVGVHLDPICALPDLIADDAHQIVDAAGFLCPLRHFPRWRKPSRSVAASRDDRTRDDEHARTWEDSLFDGLFDADVGLAGAF